MKVSVIIPSFKSFDWLAICLYHYQKFPIPVDHEILVIDNSPGDPSIKVATETALGNNVKVYPGQFDFTSHGQGYNVGYNQAKGDWIFTSETDSFPISEGWFNQYLNHTKNYAIIGPKVPQSSGTYIHPAGCLYKREVIEDAISWQNSHKDWVFLGGLAQIKGLADWGYHVVCPRNHAIVSQLTEGERKAMEVWDTAGVFQEMRSFDIDDHVSNYSARNGIKNFEPREGVETYLRVGYESGQWLDAFARHKGYSVFEAPNHIEWIPGMHGQQAACSTIFRTFFHAWGGSVYNLPNDYSEKAKEFKARQRHDYFSQLPIEAQKEIQSLKSKYDI